MTAKISINFQGGAHGHYLKFVCNRFLAGLVTSSNTPFNYLGASHQDVYLGDVVFECGHWTFLNQPLPGNQIVSIQLTHDDLLAVQSVSLLRAGNANFHANELEIDTYNKLSLPYYVWVRDRIRERFLQDQVARSYSAVMDPSWPMVTTLKEYHALPDYIKDECENVHGLMLHQWDKQSPDCPRYVLRDFFKLGFLKPEEHGFMTCQRDNESYDSSYNVYRFPFSCFYNTEKFQQELEKLAAWGGFVLNTQGLEELHKEFLEKQIFKDCKQKCDSLAAKILSGEDFDLPQLNVIEEGYTESIIETTTGITLPEQRVAWFARSQDILTLLNHDKITS